MAIKSYIGTHFTFYFHFDFTDISDPTDFSDWWRVLIYLTIFTSPGKCAGKIS